MLFNSFEFIFLFLPLVYIAYLASGKLLGFRASIAVLVAGSLIFYSVWNPSLLVLLVSSIVINYYLGRLIKRHPKGRLLLLGIIFNLGLIAYFKYFGFLVGSVASALAMEVALPDIILPLAISFFTFQQIAYLVDVKKYQECEEDFLSYALFVSFFPQLIAGPIVHHKEMLPQFKPENASTFNATNFAIGLSIFAVGLFKKTVLADTAAPYANAVFAKAENGVAMDLFESLGGVLAYTFQLYFDFSGYSDMAIGLARMFGIILPLNFFSPYKALNISEFWRRWHITLSTFLRDYLYIALGGNRKGQTSRLVNLMITMLLGGLWHGAGWNFVIWGGLHGLYLVVFHLKNSMPLPSLNVLPKRLKQVAAWLLTFICVITAWVFFRATSLEGAMVVLQGMFGINGAAMPSGLVNAIPGLKDGLAIIGIGVNGTSGSAFIEVWVINLSLLAIAIGLPNTAQIFDRVQFALNTDKFIHANPIYLPLQKRFTFTLTADHARWAAVCMALSLMTLTQVSEFLYFRF